MFLNKKYIYIKIANTEIFNKYILYTYYIHIKQKNAWNINKNKNSLKRKK